MIWKYLNRRQTRYKPPNSLANADIRLCSPFTFVSFQGTHGQTMYENVQNFKFKKKQ